MGNVYANGKEVSSKKTTNKSAPAMMSVCLSPPSPPAGPVPIPYPVTDMASNTTDGTGSVFIKQKEVGKKNGSNYKKCKGNEPATRNFGMDVVSHTIQGKTKFEAYSFDVMFEKDGAERFMDMTTTNHMNPASAVGMSVAKAALAASSGSAKCEKLGNANRAVRRDMKRRSRTKEAKKRCDKPTITHGVFTSAGGASKVVRACSNKRRGAYYAAMAKGATPNKSKRTKKSSACGGHVYQEARTSQRPHTSHTEARIIEDLFKRGSPSGGTLLLNIDWKTANSKDACKHCKKLLCAVDSGSNPKEGCIKILICAKGSPPKPKTPKQLKYCKGKK